MAVYTYDPAQIIVSIAGIPISGYTDATFLEIVRNEDTWSMVTGADGYTTRGKTNNKSGQITLTLKQSSPSNDVLSGLMQLDELSNSGIFPILIKDISGNSTYFSGQGWIQSWPTSTFDKAITDRQWIIAVAELDLFVGGNSETA